MTVRRRRNLNRAAAALLALSVVFFCFVVTEAVRADFGPAQGAASGGGVSAHDLLDGGTAHSDTADGGAPTRGDLVVANSTPAWSELTLGAADTILGSNAGGTDPSYRALSAYMDAALGSTQGQVAYRDASGWTVLAPGTSGQVLESGGAAANVAWGTDDTGSGGTAQDFFPALRWFAPAANWATITYPGHADTRVPCLTFDDTTAEDAWLLARLDEDYAGGGLTVYIYWASDAITGVGGFDVQIGSITPDADPITSVLYAAANSGSDTAAGTTMEIIRTSVTFTDGADMDSLAAGELFFFSIARDPAVGSDLTGDIFVLGAGYEETP